MKNIPCIGSLLFIFLISLSHAQETRQTVVSIQGEDFYINGKPTYKGVTWRGARMEGLLLNSRMVNGIFDDVNPETRELFQYPDTGEWDAGRNTDEFVNAMDEWHAHGRSIVFNADTRVAIGLNKTATIKGSLSYFATEKSYQITQKLSGLSVIAVDDAGNTFAAKTDDTGNFILYVPKGTYTVTLEKAGVSEYIDIENNNQQVTAEPNEVKEVKLKLNIKEKRVETRKFTSDGFKKNK